MTTVLELSNPRTGSFRISVFYAMQRQLNTRRSNLTLETSRMILLLFLKNERPHGMPVLKAVEVVRNSLVSLTS